MSVQHSNGISATLEIPYEEALPRVVEALQQEGFGVLTEIDVKATLKKKLDADFRKYKILGACNPHLAHRALQAELELGLLLPCNVIVYEADGGQTVVTAVDPLVMMNMTQNNDLQEIAEEANAKLKRALQNLVVG